MIIKYNDNELLYLISEKDEVALEIMMNKYEPLIKSMLVRYKIKSKNFEDFYQECLMTLYNCVNKYREDRKISFNSYLEMSLNYCIQNILRKEKSYFYDVVLMEMQDLDYILPVKEEETIEYSFEKLSQYEKKVLKYLSEGYTIPNISLQLNKESRSIYNTISRIKNKSKIGIKLSKKDTILSDFEKRVYDKYLLGFKANEIAYLLRTDINSIYNALNTYGISMPCKTIELEDADSILKVSSE